MAEKIVVRNICEVDKFLEEKGVIGASATASDIKLKQ